MHWNKVVFRQCIGTKLTTLIPPKFYNWKHVPSAQKELQKTFSLRQGYSYYPLDTGHQLNVYKTLRKRPGIAYVRSISVMCPEGNLQSILYLFNETELLLKCSEKYCKRTDCSLQFVCFSPNLH